MWLFWRRKVEGGKSPEEEGKKMRKAERKKMNKAEKEKTSKSEGEKSEGEKMNKAEKEKMSKSEGEKFSESGQKSEGRDHLRVGKILCSNGETKHFALLGDESLPFKKQLEMLLDYKDWNLEMPDYILETNPSVAPDSEFLDEDEAQKAWSTMNPKKEKSWLQKVKDIFFWRTTKDNPNSTSDEKGAKKGKARAKQGHFPNSRCNENEAEDDEEKGNVAEEETIKTSMNETIHRKVKEYLSKVIIAMDSMEPNSWWIVFRGKPAKNEKLINEAIRSANACPKVLVVDDPGDEVFEELDKYSKELPRDETTKGDEKVTESYTDKGDLFAIGTHFIFCKNCERFDIDSILCYTTGHICMNGFDGADGSNDTDTTSTLRGSVGNTADKPAVISFANTKRGSNDSGTDVTSSTSCDTAFSKNHNAGQKRTEDIIREAITKVRPCILIDNTGGTTQKYTKMIDKIKKQVKAFNKTQKRTLINSFKGEVDFKGEVNKEEAKRLRKFLLTKMEDEEEMKKYRSDVIMIVDEICKNKNLFETVVVTVDPLNDLSDDDLKKWASSYARSTMERKEIGAGKADESSVKNAWKGHYQIVNTLVRKQRVRGLLYSAYIISTFISVVFTIMISSQGRGIWDDIQYNLTWGVLAFPALASICSGMCTIGDFDGQVRRLHIAKAKIKFEIFNFLMRVGKYSISNFDVQDTVTKDPNYEVSAKQMNSSNIKKESRDTFARAIEQIQSDLSTTSIYHLPTERALKDHICDTLHLDDVADLFVIPDVMVADDYYEYRLKNFCCYVDKKEDCLGKRTRFWQYTGLTFTVLGTLGGGALVAKYHAGDDEDDEDYEENIPAFLTTTFLALSTSCFQFLRAFDYERRFCASKEAARAASQLKTYWMSKRAVEKDMPKTREHLVLTCEQLALQYASDNSIRVDASLMGEPDRGHVKDVHTESDIVSVC